MSKGSPPPTNQTSPDTTWLSGAPVVTTFVVNTALGPNFDSAASSVTSFSMEAGARGRDGLELNTVRPLTATVRQDVAGVRLMRSLRWVTSRRSATGAAMSSGTRRADRTGVIGDCTLEVPAAVRIEGTFALHAPLVALDAHAQEDDAVDVGVARRHLEHRRNRVLRLATGHVDWIVAAPAGREVSVELFFQIVRQRQEPEAA